MQTILRWSEDKFVFKDILVELISEESRTELRNIDQSTDFSLESHHTRRLKYIQPASDVVKVVILAVFVENREKVW